jgi:hypothetical protein
MASLKNIDYHSDSAASKGLQRFRETLNNEAELNSPDLDIIHLCQFKKTVKYDPYIKVIFSAGKFADRQNSSLPIPRKRSYSATVFPPPDRAIVTARRKTRYLYQQRF